MGWGDNERKVRKFVPGTERAENKSSMHLAVLRRELPAGRKGEESDVEGVLGFVADFDDAEAHRWAGRLPAPPQYVLETSTARFQAFYLFDRPETTQPAKAIAGRLKISAACHHSPPALSHVCRIPAP